MTMAARTVVCTICGARTGADRPFCTGCGRPLSTGLADLAPSGQTQFSLPDYLLHPASNRRPSRPAFLDEPPGPGLLISGAIAIGAALMFSRLTAFGAGLIAIGILLLLGGLWQRRMDRTSLERVGWAAAFAGALAVAGVIGQAASPRPQNGPVAGIALPTSAAGQPAAEAEPEPGAGSMPMERGDAARSGRNSGPGPDANNRIVARWRVYAGGEAYASPIVAEGMAILPTRTGELLAIDAATGEERWRTDLGGYVARSTAAANDAAVFVATGYSVVAVSLADGGVLWRAPIRFAGPSAPLLDGGRVILATQEGSVYAFDARSGKQVWSRHNDGLVFGAAALSDGRVYIGNERGQVFALDAAGGREIWRADAGGEIRGGLAVSGGSLFVTTRVPSLVALATDTGRTRWTAPTGGDTAPSIRNGLVHHCPEEGGLVVMDSRSGRVNWRASGNGLPSGPPVIAGDEIYLGIGNTVAALDAGNGAMLWQYTTAGAIAGSPAVVGGMVFAASADGYLYALGAPIESGGGLEESAQTG